MENTAEETPAPVENKINELVKDEVLRAKIRKYLDDKPKSKWEFLKHPLLALVIGFALTTVVGTYLTNQYTAKQKDKDRESSFYDEVNKTRVSKIGEVWEKVYELENLSDKLIDDYRIFDDHADSYDAYYQGLWKHVDPQSRKIRVEYLRNQFYNSGKTLSETRASVISKFDQVYTVLVKNRFWIGERSYVDLQEYLRLDKLLCKVPLSESRETQGIPDKEFEILTASRNQIRKSVVEMRERVFKE